MNYQKIYDQLIERARNRIPEGYVERHHIIPRCMGGSDEKENLVALYPEEHFVAHALLLKIYKDTEYRYALAKAVQKMTIGHKGRRNNRKLYGWLKREHALAMSESQKGKGNSQHGTRWICHLDLKENRKIGKDEEIPEGWILGRNRWKVEPPVIRNDRSKSEYAERLFLEFINSGCGNTQQFADLLGRSQASLTMLFRAHIPTYKEISRQGKPFCKEEYFALVSSPPSKRSLTT